jgi:hypothetical protein
MRTERVDRGMEGLFFQSLSSAVMRGSAAGKRIKATWGPLSLKRGLVASARAGQQAFMSSSYG